MYLEISSQRLWPLDHEAGYTQISNFVKIRPVRGELFHADRRTDGRTDMTKVIVDFCNFAKARKTPTRRP